ncbi:hypothetical protein EP47_02065 [Legionella norrlandica]|uniref:N-acetyltransferase domain-containing protein n=1 Tax=Legionella norrlandica TaxID=1498499 RepID=A0A0A2STI6_9GAMM|nr:GNAT family N-acetyltransferase [Legionella norrlandica]KGP62759.1 hypothetical protein EP47_02065 [Legionella norrlandica]
MLSNTNKRKTESSNNLNGNGFGSSQKKERRTGESFIFFKSVDLFKQYNVRLVTPGRDEGSIYRDLHITSYAISDGFIKALESNGYYADVGECTEYFIRGIQTKDDNRIVGAIYYQFGTDDNAFIDSLYIEKDSQRKGYGSLLLLSTFQQLRDFSCKKMRLCVTSASVNMYTKFGFLPNLDVLNDDERSEYDAIEDEQEKLECFCEFTDCDEPFEADLTKPDTLAKINAFEMALKRKVQSADSSSVLSLKQ